MNLDDAVKLMSHTDGYCLWVGAGLTIQLARAGSVSAPTWADLCERLEQTGEIAPAAPDFPGRLEASLQRLGRVKFQALVRDAILNPLCDGILGAAETHADPDDCVPKAVRQISALGSLANPIVNFNVETLTSSALAHAAGPFVVRSFAPPIPDIKGLPRASGGGTHDSRRFRRAVYHPHGALDAGGICVLAESDYSAMRGTLALQLATHAAFGARLFIVGMSLQDRYLRDQIEQFIDQMNGIFWFVDPTVDVNLLAWAARVGVTTIEVIDWATFWSKVETTLPAPTPLNAVLTWSHVLSSAIHLRSPGAYRWVFEGFEKAGASATLIERWRRFVELTGVALEPIDQQVQQSFESRTRPLLQPLLVALGRLSE